MKNKIFSCFILIMVFSLSSCSVFLDKFIDQFDISKLPETGSNIKGNYIDVTPAGGICVKVGNSITLTAKYYENGTKKDASFNYVINPNTLGSFTGNTFTAKDTVGNGTITISLKSDSSIKKTISLTVYDSDESFVDVPFYYNNKIYYGAKQGLGIPNTTSEITVNYPQNKTFDAYGFFNFKGKVRNDSCYNYLYVSVVKDSDNTLVSQYFVRGDFDTKIWLRFGPGTYTVSVCKLSSITADLNGDGFISRWSYSVFDTYSVNNICSEDGRYLYPSNMVQSDDVKITQVVSNLTKSSDSDSTKAKVLHDYVVDLLTYDNDSLVSGKRKKQDAVTAFTKKLGVCEGYADLLAALYRAAGLPCKVISGTGVTSSGSGGHAWNNVQIDGVWKFIDATWDDTAVTTKYYLLSSMTGVNNDHIIDEPQPKGYLGRSAYHEETIIWSNM